MMLPEALHRHWNVIEPALFASVGGAGASVMLLLAPEAQTPAEYGGLFVGFLVFLGFGVLGVVTFTASYIAKGAFEAFAGMAGENAAKLVKLHSQEQFDARFKEVEEGSAERTNHLLGVIEKVNETLIALKSTTELLNQRLEQEVRRGDELREAITNDVSELRSELFHRRNTDPKGIPS